MACFHFSRNILSFIIPFLFCIACNNAQQKTETKKIDSILQNPQQKNILIPGNFSAQSALHFNSDKITEFLKKYPLFKPLQKDIEQFYSSRNYAYAWFDNNGMIEQAGDLFNHIINIGQEGLPQKIQYKDSLETMFDEASSSIKKENEETELMLTAQYFNYAKSVYAGVPESTTKSMEWFLPRKKIDLPKLMDSLLNETSSSLISDDYNYRQYALLKNYLKKYKEIERLGKWVNIIAEKKSYRIGDSSATISAIRKKLYLLGDLDEQENNLFDDKLKEAVKHFQQRFGMKEDGIIGAAMINKFNQPISKYIQQIVVNMERCRWIPASLNGNYFVVNIPAFQLFAYEKDSLLFSMKVVVGKSLHKTTIFSGNLKYVVFSPYWNVPPDIMKNEVLPAIRRDPNYLQRNNMEWDGKAVRQKPGPKNSLGLVKFLFPNSYHIYLHDSPAKSLFNEHSRAFSHGCIRVAEPKKLVVYLLRNDSSWTESKIDDAMKLGKEKYVTLKKTVPVFIAYFTNWVDRNGKLNIRDDIYKRDKRLAEMLFNKK